MPYLLSPHKYNDITTHYNIISIELRATLHISKVQWISNITIKVAINYSINDATNKVVGLQKVFISEYSPTTYKGANHSY